LTFDEVGKAISAEKEEGVWLTCVAFSGLL